MKNYVKLFEDFESDDLSFLEDLGFSWLTEEMVLKNIKYYTFFNPDIQEILLSGEISTEIEKASPYRTSIVINSKSVYSLKNALILNIKENGEDHWLSTELTELLYKDKINPNINVDWIFNFHEIDKRLDGRYYLDSNVIIKMTHTDYPDFIIERQLDHQTYGNNVNKLLEEILKEFDMLHMSKIGMAVSPLKTFGNAGFKNMRTELARNFLDWINK